MFRLPSPMKMSILCFNIISLTDNQEILFYIAFICRSEVWDQVRLKLLTQQKLIAPFMRDLIYIFPIVLHA